MRSLKEFGECVVSTVKQLLSPSVELSQREGRFVRLGSTTLTERDLLTNVLTTGGIGSGKTSSVIYPVLDQVCGIYNEDTEDPTAPNQKWGGLVLDVKGELYENLIYFLHKSGRNVLDDVILIRPDADYQIVKMQDTDTGYYWYIPATGGWEAREIDYVVDGYTLADGSKIPSYLFTWDAEQRIEHEEYLKTLTFEITRPLRFVGWREEDGKQVRVKYTAANGEVHYMLDSQGAKIKVDTPKRLKYIAVEKVTNDICYNICNPNLRPDEVASRLISISETLGCGDNSYWLDTSRKFLGFIIHLWRIVDGSPVSALEIVKLTSQKEALDAALSKLESQIAELDADLQNVNEPIKLQEQKAKLHLLRDVQQYFSEVWGKMDPKTKGAITSGICNLFGPFLTDIQLQEVFCRPSTINFEDAIQNGKVFVLLASGGYETQAKLLGSSLKMDFQAACKSRLAQAHLNKVRVVMFMADEAQVYVTSGGGNNTGDENFMALSRQNRVINFISTQSDSSIISVIGERKAPVYFQSFGCRIWLQNTDYTTNQNAALMLGSVKEADSKFSIDSVFAKTEGGTKPTEFIESEQFGSEVFSNLKVFEAITYNTGTGKAIKYQGKPHDVCSPNSKEAEQRNAVIRWFHQAYIENRLNQLEASHEVDHTAPE